MITHTEIPSSAAHTARPLDLDHLAAIARALDAHAKPAATSSSPAPVPHDHAHRDPELCCAHRGHSTWITWPRSLMLSMPTRSPPATSAHQLTMITPTELGPAAHTAATRPGSPGRDRSRSRCPREARRQHPAHQLLFPMITHTEIPSSAAHTAATRPASPGRDRSCSRCPREARPATSAHQLTMTTHTEIPSPAAHTAATRPASSGRDRSCSRCPTPSPPAHQLTSSPAHHDHAHRDPEPCSTHRGHSILDHSGRDRSCSRCPREARRQFQLTSSP
jgi:hypothetical protein